EVAAEICHTINTAAFRSPGNLDTISLIISKPPAEAPITIKGKLVSVNLSFAVANRFSSLPSIMTPPFLLYILNILKKSHLINFTIAQKEEGPSFARDLQCNGGM